jgi:hypothetical protein
MLSDSRRINRRHAYTAPKAAGNHCESDLNSSSSRKHQREAQSPLIIHIADNAGTHRPLSIPIRLDSTNAKPKSDQLETRLNSGLRPTTTAPTWNIPGYVSGLSVEVPKEFVGSNSIDCLTWCKAIEILGTFSDRQQAMFIRSYQAKEGYTTENAPFLKIIPH